MPSISDEALEEEAHSTIEAKASFPVEKDASGLAEKREPLKENKDNPSLSLVDTNPDELTDEADSMKIFPVGIDENHTGEKTEMSSQINDACNNRIIKEKRKLTTTHVISNQEDLFDAFEDFAPTRLIKRKKLKHLPRSEKKIAVRIMLSSQAENENCTQNDSFSLSTQCKDVSDAIWWEKKNDNNYHEDETFMEFYQDTHEEQSPSYQAFIQQKAEDEIRLELKKIEEKDREGRAAIERILADQMAEKKKQADLNINRYVQRVQQEEKRDHQKLKGLYQQRLEENQQKVTNSMKILQRRQQKEMQVAGQSHQQRVQQQQIPEHIATAEWQSVLRQLQGKHQRQQHEFKKKAEELKKKTDADYSREELKIRNQHDTKIKDAEKSRQKLVAKLVSHFQQVRQRYLKQHIQRIVQDRNELTKDCDDRKKKKIHDSGDREPEKNNMEERPEFNPPLPIKSHQPWVEESPYEISGAASRHKHRKGVMSQTRRQLSVEIHNEGIWVSVLKSEDDNKRGGVVQAETGSNGDSAAREEFIPWGVQAHDFLESIVCGELPTMFERSKSFRETEATQGGQVRCILADLRVSDAVASSQRAVAAREHEELGVEALEKKYTEMSKIVADLERQISVAENEEKEYRTIAESTAKEVAKAKRCQDEFRSKFRNYLGPDGNPLQTTNPRDRQELSKATLQYKSIVDKAQRREQAIFQKLAEIKAKISKLQNSAKTALRTATAAATALKKKKASMSNAGLTLSSQPTKADVASNTERASIRIKETLDVLRRTAEKRREQAHQKQTNSFSNSIAQMFPDLPMPLKKSIWHKMHRRKQQIILRPTEESLINDLRSTTQEILATKTQIGEKSSEGLSAVERQHHLIEKMRKLAAEEKELIKAEQLFLLAMHPAATENLRVVPPAKSSDAWGEPGWQIILEVPKDNYRDRSILPRAETFPVFEQHYSEIASAPGRQAASLLKSSNLRCLALSQSLFSTSSSPAEPTTTQTIAEASTYGDPLFLSHEDMKLGYTFSVRQLGSPTNLARKKSAATNERQALPMGSQKSKKPTITSLPSMVYTPVSGTTAKNMKAKAAAAATTITKQQPKKRRSTSVKEPAASLRSQKKKVEVAATNRRPSQTGAIPMMPYPYSQPSRQLSQQQQATQGRQTQQQQYTPQQMAQFRMIQQQQQQQQQQQTQQSTGANQTYQQQPFFPPGLTPQQMQQMQARHQHMMHQTGQQQPPPSRNSNDSNDPLFMLK